MEVSTPKTEGKLHHAQRWVPNKIVATGDLGHLVFFLSDSFYGKKKKILTLAITFEPLEVTVELSYFTCRFLEMRSFQLCKNFDQVTFDLHI